MMFSKVQLFQLLLLRIIRKNSIQNNTAPVRYMSNHRGSKDVVRICNLLQRKVDNSVTRSNVSIQVSQPCVCKTKVTCDTGVQTEPISSETRKVSFDINFNWPS